MTTAARPYQKGDEAEKINRPVQPPVIYTLVYNISTNPSNARV
jgi:hypothetical protein